MALVPSRGNNRIRNKFAREDKERKRMEAQARQEAYDKLTPAEKLAQLDQGKMTHGKLVPGRLAAKKQRAKLNKLLAEAVAAKAAGRPSIADQLKAKK